MYTSAEHELDNFIWRLNCVMPYPVYARRYRNYSHSRQQWVHVTIVSIDNADLTHRYLSLDANPIEQALYIGAHS